MFSGVEEQTNGQYNTKPCLGNTKVYERSMKFKVYVCTDEEEKQGKCQPCKTEGCYYARKYILGYMALYGGYMEYFRKKFVLNLKLQN